MFSPPGCPGPSHPSPWTSASPPVAQEKNNDVLPCLDEGIFSKHSPYQKCVGASPVRMAQMARSVVWCPSNEHTSILPTAERPALNFLRSSVDGSDSMPITIQALQRAPYLQFYHLFGASNPVVCLFL